MTNKFDEIDIELNNLKSIRSINPNDSFTDTILKNIQNPITYHRFSNIKYIYTCISTLALLTVLTTISIFLIFDSNENNNFYSNHRDFYLNKVATSYSIDYSNYNYFQTKEN